MTDEVRVPQGSSSPAQSLKIDGDANSSELRMRRRTIVKGAAWSIPVVAASMAVPGASASAACPGSGSFTAPSPQVGVNASASSTSSTFVVPAGVTQLTFTIAGGAGGIGTAPGTALDRQQGQLVTGTIAVSAGQAFSLIVGQGGAYSNGTQQGGQGYGAGGNVTRPATTGAATENIVVGGSGGGGSAILLGGSPVVVAGGGGGRGHYAGIVNTNDPNMVPDTTATSNGARQGTSLRAVHAEHGANASGTTGGAGGSAWDATGNVLLASNRNLGLSGSFSSTGGIGADGVAVSRARAALDWRVASVSGAGGGGYAGGGSGASASATWSASGTFQDALLAVSGAGGQGSNFWAANVTATASLAGNAVGGTAYRSPGWITLSWTC